MKALAAICALIFLCAHSPLKETKTYLLNDALDKNLISVVITTTEESTHYFEPLTITVTNLTSERIKITIPNGQIFKSVDPEAQDIIGTQTNDIVLSKYPVSRALQGMCIQSSNRAPNDADTFLIGEIATNNLLLLTQEIEKTYNFNSTAQHAVWAIANNKPLMDIEGPDDKVGIYFQNFTKKLLGLSDVEMVKPEDLIKEPKRTMGGTFKYIFSKTSSVSIAIFNDKNVVVRELFSDPEKEAGEHKLDFQFDAADFPEELYFVKLIIDNRIKINKRLYRKA